MSERGHPIEAPRAEPPGCRSGPRSSAEPIPGARPAIFAVGPAKAAIPIFLTQTDWSLLQEGDLAGQLIATGVLLMLSLGLLFWPKTGHTRKIFV